MPSRSDQIHRSTIRVRLQRVARGAGGGGASSVPVSPLSQSQTFRREEGYFIAAAAAAPQRWNTLRELLVKSVTGSRLAFKKQVGGAESCVRGLSVTATALFFVFCFSNLNTSDVCKHVGKKYTILFVGKKKKEKDKKNSQLLGEAL